MAARALSITGFSNPPLPIITTAGIVLAKARKYRFCLPVILSPNHGM